MSLSESPVTPAGASPEQRVAEPIHVRPNGRVYLFLDECTEQERRYFRVYRSLPPVAQQQLRDLATYLAAGMRE